MQGVKGQGGGSERLQREVLAMVLVEHPVRHTLAGIQAEVGQAPEVERAVAALIADGLLLLEDDEVAPTEAALRFHEIEPIDPPGLN